MANFFTKVIHWGGIAFTKTLEAFHVAEVNLDKYAPQIEKALMEGATVAAFIPGLGPEVAGGLNLGSELVGALDKTLHYTDETFQAMVNQAKASLQPGYSLLVIPQELEAEAKAYLLTIEATFAKVKSDAQALTGKAGAPAAAAAKG